MRLYQFHYSAGYPQREYTGYSYTGYKSIIQYTEHEDKCAGYTTRTNWILMEYLNLITNLEYTLQTHMHIAKTRG